MIVTGLYIDRWTDSPLAAIVRPMPLQRRWVVAYSSPALDTWPNKPITCEPKRLERTKVLARKPTSVWQAMFALTGITSDGPNSSDRVLFTSAAYLVESRLIWAVEDPKAFDKIRQDWSTKLQYQCFSGYRCMMVSTCPLNSE
jgi:hypothetical protein